MLTSYKFMSNEYRILLKYTEHLFSYYSDNRVFELITGIIKYNLNYLNFLNIKLFK